MTSEHQQPSTQDAPPVRTDARRRRPGQPRRNQAERSAQTRQRLLDAAIACLVEVGYSETTTTAVAARAGLTRGAMLHHFGLRADLIRAVGFEVLRQSEADFLRLRTAASLRRETFEAAFDIAGSQADRPYLMAAVEVMIGCRADPELRDFYTDLFRMSEEKTRAHLTAWAVASGVENGARLDAFLDLAAVVLSGGYVQIAASGGREKIGTAFAQLRAIAKSLLPASRQDDP